MVKRALCVGEPQAICVPFDLRRTYEGYLLKAKYPVTAIPPDDGTTYVGRVEMYVPKDQELWIQEGDLCECAEAWLRHGTAR